MLCKICQHGTRTLNDQKSGKIYYACNKCHFIFLDEEFLLSHEEEKRRYALHNNTFHNEGYVAMFNDFINEVIEPHKQSIKVALDYGCGPTPVLATMLKSLVPSVDYYDPYFYSGLDLEQKCYDLITTTEVIEHMKDPLDEITRLITMLSSQGYLAIMTLFHPENDDSFLTWWYRRDETHVAFYSMQTFMNIAEMLGLKIAHSNNKNYCLFQTDD